MVRKEKANKKASTPYILLKHVNNRDKILRIYLSFHSLYTSKTNKIVVIMFNFFACFQFFDMVFPGPGCLCCIGEFFSGSGKHGQHLSCPAPGLDQLFIGFFQAVGNGNQVFLTCFNLLLQPFDLTAQVIKDLVALFERIGVDDQHQQDYGTKTAEHDIQEGEVKGGEPPSSGGCGHGAL